MKSYWNKNNKDKEKISMSNQLNQKFLIQDQQQE